MKLTTRMDFVEKWADFIKNNSDERWSELQAELIDSQLENAEQIKLTKKQIDYIKRRKN